MLPPANKLTAKVKIPSNLSGNFVLRHEIIALHSAGQTNGAQNYPQCINLKVTGSGKTKPCNEGADCRKGTKLYKANEKGIVFNIYTTLSTYVSADNTIWLAIGHSLRILLTLLILQPIPGPKVFKGLSKRFAQAFKA